MRDPLGQLRLRFAGLHAVHSGAHAQVYAGKDFGGRAVTVVVLTEAAATDNDRRAAYRRAAAALAPAQAALDPYVERPWAAFYDDPQSAIESVFAALGEPAPEASVSEAPVSEAHVGSSPHSPVPPPPDTPPPGPGTAQPPPARQAIGTPAPDATSQGHPPVPPPPGPVRRPPAVSQAPSEETMSPRIAGLIFAGLVVLSICVCACLGRLN